MSTKKLNEALDLIKKAGCEDLTFDIEENKLFLKAENRDGVSINIPFDSHEKNSVSKSKLKYENEILISISDFEEIVQKVLPAVGKEFTNVFKGILFEIDGKNLRCTGADRSQLASLNIKVKKSSKKDRFIIPYNSIKTFADKIKKFNSKNFIIIRYTNKEFLKIFSISQVEFNFHEEGNFIDEKFPQYEKIFPSAFKATAKLKTSEFKKILDIISPIVNRCYKDYLKIIFAPDKLIIKSNAEGVGTGKVFTEADTYGFETITINYKKIISELNGINSEYLQLEIYEQSEKEMFSLHEVGNENFIYITSCFSHKEFLKKSHSMIEKAEKRIADAKLVYEKLRTNLKFHKQIYDDVPLITLSEASEKIFCGVIL